MNVATPNAAMEVYEDRNPKVSIFFVGEKLNKKLSRPVGDAWPIHSSRSSIMGSIDRARCAGIHVASIPSKDIARTTPAKTSGSLGVA